jgi:hypothetical protein
LRAGTQRGAVFGRNLSTNRTPGWDFLRALINWRQAYWWSVHFDLHGNFSCLNGSAIGVSRKRFQSTTEDVENRQVTPLSILISV